MGLIRTARRAGIMPARAPETINISSAVMAILKSTSGCWNISLSTLNFINAKLIPSTRATPTASPKYPATEVRECPGDSQRAC